MDFTKAYPDPVNVALLIEELRATFAEVTARESDCTVHNVAAQDEATIDALLAAHDASALSEAQEQTSFVDAMRPLLRDWHKGTTNTADTLTAASTVLGNHPNHQTVMFNVVWSNVRAGLMTLHPADVSVGNISGNAAAEALFIRALFDYVTRVKMRV